MQLRKIEEACKQKRQLQQQSLLALDHRKKYKKVLVGTKKASIF